jgi:putative ABC transport system substrate-binding protein
MIGRQFAGVGNKLVVSRRRETEAHQCQHPAPIVLHQLDIRLAPPCRLSRVAVVWNPDHPDPDLQDTQAAATRLGIRLQSIEVRRADDFEGALPAAERERAEALIVVSSRLMNLRQAQLLDFAAKNKIPLVTGWGSWVQNGALLSYGLNIDEVVRRSDIHVDKILRGARPADIPIEQPTRFELVVSVKTARLLNLTVPASLLARADRVVE